MNFNDIGMLLHLKEKLMGHPKLLPLMAHVDAALENHAAEATHEKLPEKKLTKQEEEQREAAARAEKDRTAAEEKARAEEQAGRAVLANEAARQRAEQEQRRQLNADEALKASGQPRVPEPDPRQDLSRMNNPPGTRVEERLNPQAGSPAPEPEIERKI